MRQLIIEQSGGPVAWVDAPEPQLDSPAGAIVRPIVVGVCDVDRRVVQGGFPLPGPIVLGHEIIAEVVSIGTAVERVKPGMRVIVPLQVNCGECEECHRQRTNCCSSRPTVANYGIGPTGGDRGGGMSDLLLVPYADAMLVQLPDDVDPADYVALSCNLVDNWRGVAPYVQDYDVPSLLVLSGAKSNTFSYYALTVAAALGVSDVTFASDVPEHRAVAEGLGAKSFSYADLPARDYKIVCDNAGAPEKIAEGIRFIARGGTCTTATPYLHSIEFPFSTVFQRNVNYNTGQPHVRALIEQVLPFVKDQRLGTLKTPHEIFKWDDAPREYGWGDVKRVFVRE